MGKKTMRSRKAAQEQRKKQIRKQRIIGLVLIIAALVILAAGGFFLLQERQEQKEADAQMQNSGYEEVISTYYSAIISEDGKRLSQIMAPPAYWTYYLEEYDKTEEEVISDFTQGCTNTLEEWKSLYGEDVEVTFQIKGISEQGQDGIEEWNADMQTMIGNAELSISEAVTLEVQMQFSGSLGSDTQTIYPTIGKIGESWYMLSEDDVTLGGDVAETSSEAGTS